MKTETKTIILGIIITLLVLGGSLFILYKVFGNSDTRVSNENTDYKTSSKDENNVKEPTTNDTNQNTTTSSEVKTTTDNKINESKDNQVTIYIFRGEGCPHCEDAIEYFKNNFNSKNIKVKAYETWKNSNNAELMEMVATKLNTTVSGVPFIVIGDYFKVGFGDGDELVDVAKKKVKNKDFKDPVETVLEENKDLDVTVEDIK